MKKILLSLSLLMFLCAQYCIAQSSTVLDLSSQYNVYAIGAPGSVTAYGGITGYSGAVYNTNTLGTSVTYQGLTFTLGSPNAFDSVANYATFSIPSGTYGYLYVIANHANGPTRNDVVTVTYTDSSTSTYTQDISDWQISFGYRNETIVASLANQLDSSGAVVSKPTYLYGYTYPLAYGKTPSTVSFTPNENVFGIGLGGTPALGTSTALSVTSNTPSAGSSDTLTANVTSSLATGTVTFYDYSTAISGPVSLSSGSASYSVTSILEGQHRYTAFYSGSSSYAQSLSPAVGVTATDSTPDTSGTQVDLSSLATVYLIGTVGTSLSTPNLSWAGSAFDSSTLGASVAYHGLTLDFGAANSPSGTTTTTVTLPSGTYGNLYIAGVYGDNLDAVHSSLFYTVTYTDGSTSSYLQNMSNYAVPSGYSGESTLIATPNVLNSSGTSVSTPAYVHGYTFPLVNGKTASSVTLPTNSTVTAMVMGLGGAALTASSTSLSASSTSTTTGSAVTLTVSVTGGSSGGTVTLMDYLNYNRTLVGSAPLSGGSASFTVGSIAYGTHSYTATYSGSASDAASAGTVTVTAN